MLSRRLLIVDEQSLYLLGLREALQSCPLLRIVGEAGTAHQALQLAVQTRPHMAIVAESLPGISGLTLISSLAGLHRPCAAIVLMDEIDQRAARAARSAGAIGVISRGIDSNELRIAVERAISRPAPAQRFSRDSHRAIGIPLSPREMEILDCVTQGFTNREIADALFVTEQTVKNHLTSVFRKLEVEDRVQALLVAVRKGWVTFGGQPAYDSNSRQSA